MTDKEKLYAGIAKSFNVPVESLTDETLFNDDLHARSANMFLVAGLIEDITGVHVTYSDIHSYKTLGAMADYMESLK